MSSRASTASARSSRSTSWLSARLPAPSAHRVVIQSVEHGVLERDHDRPNRISNQPWEMSSRSFAALNVSCAGSRSDR